MTDIRRFLKEYDGEPLRLMEVCGTHTAQIVKNGIDRMLSPRIELISGPGCPVCVTVSSYIDRLVELACLDGNVVVTFGDMMRVPGSGMSLNDARAAGGRVRMVYSPVDTLDLAQQDPAHTYIFAAVGFETTTPVYALMVEEARERGIGNVRLLTSLKTMPPAIRWMEENQGGVDGFLAPGHVSVVIGSDAFVPLAEQYGIPFAVAGFEGEEILEAIYALVRLRGRGKVVNLYSRAVTAEGGREAGRVIKRYFAPADAAWRGLGVIPASGMVLRPEYAEYDAGSAALVEDHKANPACRCAEILTGSAQPEDCPLFGRGCTPQTPQGACMVSAEGSCFNRFSGKRGGRRG